MSKEITLGNKQDGLSLIEMMFIILIAIIVIGGAIAFGYKQMAKQQESAIQEAIATLMVNTKALRGSNGYGSTGTNLMPSLIAIDAVPDAMSVSGTTVTNSYGGAVTVVSTGMGFTLTNAGLDQAACIGLATKIGRSAFFTTRINGGSAIAGEVTAAQATAGCTGTTNSVAWTVSS